MTPTQIQMLKQARQNAINSNGIKATKEIIAEPEFESAIAVAELVQLLNGFISLERKLVKKANITKARKSIKYINSWIAGDSMEFENSEDED